MYCIKKVHIKDKELYPRLQELSILSCNLYNRALYVVRQAYTQKTENILEYQDIINDRNYINGFALRKRMCALNDFDYRSFPDNNTINNTIYGIHRSFSAFFALLKKKKNDSKLKVNMPRYVKEKDKLKTSKITIDGSKIRRKNGNLVFPNNLKLKPIKDFLKFDDVIKEIRIVCKHGEFYYYVCYESANNENQNVIGDKTLSIDVGVGNILTCVTEDGDNFIIDGKKLKSINQHFNKELSKAYSYVGDKGVSNRIQKLYHKRMNKMNNEFHNISNYIVEYCKKNGISKIVIGKNVGWKQNNKFGKRIKQHFLQIAHAELLNKIKYKCERIGIEFCFVEESHTSKCDALAKEEICHQDEYKGRRKYRGLFISSVGKQINADINGALNIMRKVKGDDFIDSVNLNKLLSPKKITI